MTDQTYSLDPQLVRELARETAQRSAGSGVCIDAVISEHDVMGEILASGDRTAYRRLYNAVSAEMKTAAVTVTWPDEKTQDELDVTLDGLIEAAHRRRPGFDEDVRVVARLKAADTTDFTPDSIAEWFAASAALYACFATRIAELEQRDTAHPRTEP